MATPHVSGAVVLYKAQNSNANAAEIKATILNTGTATASLDGKVLSGKRLNVISLSLHQLQRLLL